MIATSWTSDHLTVRYLRKADMPNVAAMLKKESVCEAVMFGPNTEQETNAYFHPLLDEIETALGKGEPPANHVFALEQPDTGAFMGECALMPISFAEGNYLLGYQLDEPFWGKRYGTWAARFLIQFAFTVLDARRISGDCLVTNEGSAKIMLSAGFKEEGIQRGYFTKSGGAVDNQLFGLLRDEIDPAVLRSWSEAFA
jgi:RimJ/RimL family protein N-acetyltransferase